MHASRSFTFWPLGVMVRFMRHNATIYNISVILWPSVFIGGWNRSSQRKPPTCCKSLTICLILFIVCSTQDDSVLYNIVRSAMAINSFHDHIINVSWLNSCISRYYFCGYFLNFFQHVYIICYSFFFCNLFRVFHKLTGLYYCIEYTSPWARFEFATLVVIGTDCTVSCKSKYHTITTTTPPSDVLNFE